MTFPLDSSSQPDWTSLTQLTVAIEELSVAEDELRVQNDELMRTRDVLAAERARYRELFEYAPVPYLVTDTGGLIADANHSAAALLHRRIDFLVGKPLVLFTRTASRRRLRTIIGHAAASPGPTSAVFTIAPREGHVVKVEATTSAVRDIDGAVVEIRWLLVDRTQRILRERLRQRRAARLELLVGDRTRDLARAIDVKDRLMATVSHEMRTVLSAIGGYADLLEMGVRGPMTDAQLADVRRIRHAYEHLNHVVDDLMNYSQVRQLKLDLANVDLRHVARDVPGLLGPEARRKSIEVETVEVDRASARAVVVRADAARVRQILINLVGNAIKFTPASGRVSVAWRVDGPYGVIEVSDSGPGIPSESAELIFQPFARLPRDASKAGTGLGLSISREFARAMDGDLTLGDAPNGGSCFALRLPLSTELARETQLSRVQE